MASLSGGQRQSVAVARAVLWNSRVVILDEPTAALGVAQTRQVLDLVRRLADRGLGVVLISHNMTEVERLCERVIIMKRGRIEDDDTPARLRERYGRETLEEVFLDVARGRDREAAQ